MLRFAVIIGSTRPNRFADTPANWIVAGAGARQDFRLDLLDLKEYPLPFFNEPAPPAYAGGKYVEPAAEKWRQTLGQYDGFIAITAEYNHGPTAVLKNALDSAFAEWIRKPVAFVGYGGVGGARAIEQLRGVVIELQMASVKQEVNIGREAYLGVLQGKALDDFPYLPEARTAMFDNLVWWAHALKAARDATAQDRAA